jgi:Methane oxygenase PmoA
VGDVTTTLTVDGVEVARYVDAAAVTDPALSPRPFLHPVRTLGGTEVTDCMPDDHRWHLGVSVAVQDVDGVNFWGGRTYVRDHGYVWRDDHGVQRHHGWRERGADRCAEELGWYAPDGRCLVVESRSLHAAPAHHAGRPGWTLGIRFRLRNVSGAPLALGSPATNGRVGAGYGGLFWRLPRSSSPPRVFTASAGGEAAVHGSTAPWLAWVADAGEPAKPFTVALANTSPPGKGQADPWFVRVESYPGMCSALAFEQPAPLAEDGVLARRFRALIVDVALDPGTVAAWLDGLP